MTYKIGVTFSQEYPVYVKSFCRGLNGTYDVEEIEMPFRDLTKQEIDIIIPRLKPYDAILVRSGIFTSTILRSLPNLRVICVHGAGYDQIDYNEAAKLGIAVLNTPGANANAVIELTMTLMLIQVRNLYESIYHLKAGHNWESAKICGGELSGKVLGLLGAGKIGFEVAKRATMFGMKVNIYDPYLSNNNFENGLNFCSCLDEMLINADIISLHAPLTDQTRHIICGSTIAKMKRGAIVINTSRGGLINEKDLYDALVSQKISAAALDVFETEPIDIHNKLLDLSNVIATPHIGGSTVESLEKVAYMAGQEIREFLETGKSKFIVNF